MTDQLAHRLRQLRDSSGMTVADMAERTGIPKRTLDKYMLRVGASQPGLEALCALSKGLGVSLDWLVFGSEVSGKAVGLVANRTANHVVRLLADAIVRESLAGKPVVSEDRILNMVPEHWAGTMGYFAQEEAEKLVASGVTLNDLLAWEQKQRARHRELLNDMVERVAETMRREAEKPLPM